MKALVLSGGGVKGAFQVGVLRKLLQENPELDYDVYTGVSVGALNSSLLATGKLKDTLPTLEEIWLKDIKGNGSVWNHNLIKWMAIFAAILVVFVSMSFMSFILSYPIWVTLLFSLLSLVQFGFLVAFPFLKILPGNKSIYTTSPLRDILKNRLDIQKLKNSGKKLRVGAVSFQSGKYSTGTEQDDNIIDWILASSSFPVFFPMQKINGEYYIDGGAKETTPLYDAIELGATEIDVIITDALYVLEKDSDEAIVTEQLFRVLDIMTTEIMINDIKLGTVDVSNKEISIRVIGPEVHFKYSPLDFNPENIMDMYNTNYKILTKPYEGQ